MLLYTPSLARRLVVACFAGSLLVGQPSAQAQQTDTIDQAAGAGTDAGQVGGITGALTPDEAFSEVARDETVGASADTVRGFSDASAATTTQGGGFGGLGGGLGGLGGLGGFGNLFGGGGVGGSQVTQPAIRTRLRSAVNVAPRTMSDVQYHANRTLQSLPYSQRMPGVHVNVHQGTAVIRGTVTNNHDRRMSELLMRLEPGVRRVQNQVIVQP